MKSMKRIQILMLATLMMFVFASPAISALSTQVTTDVDLIAVDKTAPGTKLSGPLTIYYVPTGFEVADMYVFLRLRKGYDLYSFATKIENVPYNAGGIEDQQEAIEIWIETEVIPELYCPEADILPPVLIGDPPTCASALPPVAIKSTDQTVQDDPGCEFCTDNLYFTIMDVVIAVQD